MRTKQMRYVCLDFETTGFSKPGTSSHEWPLPCANYPIQLSIDVVEDGEVTHLYDTLIKGARQFCPWVKEKVPIVITDLVNGCTLQEVVDDVAALLQDGDTIVAHNIQYDLELVLAKACKRRDIGGPALERIMAAPRFCTMRCAYTKSVKATSLAKLCAHFEVPLKDAHDARGDSQALAGVVAEAWRRGVML